MRDKATVVLSNCVLLVLCRRHQEIGLSFLIHESRHQPSTSSGKKTGSMLEYEKHSHAILPHPRVDFSGLTTSAIQTDVNQSDIGTKAFGRERLRGLRIVLGLVDVFY